MYTRLHVKYPTLSSDFNETWIFWTYLQETIKNQVSRKLRPSFESRVFLFRRTIGQINITKPIVALRNFAKRLKTNLNWWGPPVLWALVPFSSCACKSTCHFPSPEHMVLTFSFRSLRSGWHKAAMLQSAFGAAAPGDTSLPRTELGD